MAMTQSQRRVYAFVRDAARRGECPTVSEAAAETGVARSTVARVASQLGYAGWTDMTMQLRHYHSRPTEGSASVVDESARAIAEALLRGPGLPVLIDAVGDAHICVDYLLVRLGECGLLAMPFSEGFFDMRGSTGGTLLVVNESGMALLPECVEALEHGCSVVAITASHDTPVSKVATLNVVIKNQKSQVSAYEPNFFTAGVLALFERVLPLLRAQGGSEVGWRCGGA